MMLLIDQVGRRIREIRSVYRYLACIGRRMKRNYATVVERILNDLSLLNFSMLKFDQF